MSAENNQNPRVHSWSINTEICAATGDLLGASSALIGFVESQNATMNPAPAHLNRDQVAGWNMAMRLVQSCRPLARLSEAKTRLQTALAAEAAKVVATSAQQSFSDGSQTFNRLLELLLKIEMHCPCGARPESLNTHPHVAGCPVEEALSLLQ